MLNLGKVVQVHIIILWKEIVYACVVALLEEIAQVHIVKMLK